MFVFAHPTMDIEFIKDKAELYGVEVSGPFGYVNYVGGIYEFKYHDKAYLEQFGRHMFGNDVSDRMKEVA